MSARLVTMYTVEKLDAKIQETFKLDDDPYKDNSIARNYLGSMGVVHFRDEDHIEGVVIPQKDVDVFREIGWRAYRSVFELNDGGTIADWPREDVSMKTKRILRERIEKGGNTKIVLEWCKEVIIGKMDEVEVTLA